MPMLWRNLSRSGSLYCGIQATVSRTMRLGSKVVLQAGQAGLDRLNALMMDKRKSQTGQNLQSLMLQRLTLLFCSVCLTLNGCGKNTANPVVAERKAVEPSATTFD